MFKKILTVGIVCFLGPVWAQDVSFLDKGLMASFGAMVYCGAQGYKAWYEQKAKRSSSHEKGAQDASAIHDLLNSVAAECKQNKSLSFFNQAKTKIDVWKARDLSLTNQAILLRYIEQARIYSMYTDVYDNAAGNAGWDIQGNHDRAEEGRAKFAEACRFIALVCKSDEYTSLMQGIERDEVKMKKMYKYGLAATSVFACLGVAKVAQWLGTESSEQ